MDIIEAARLLRRLERDPELEQAVELGAREVACAQEIASCEARGRLREWRCMIIHSNARVYKGRRLDWVVCILSARRPRALMMRSLPHSRVT